MLYKKFTVLYRIGKESAPDLHLVYNNYNIIMIRRNLPIVLLNHVINYHYCYLITLGRENWYVYHLITINK